jgi:hypothetical protein
MLWMNVAGPSRGAYNDCAVWTSLDPIAYWKKGVESVDEVRMSVEQLGNSFNYTGRVNPVDRHVSGTAKDHVSYNRTRISKKKKY